ncbi:hypothetical protein GCM10009765_13230 [Fodinicola feengrottensis]|uniref:Uncharacterized protein n=2 Tax=Fodinicola feengrottensis TaxID=435914 RepID=A0ABP4RZP2_9ACTN
MRSLFSLFFLAFLGIAALPTPASADPITVDGYAITYLPQQISATPTAFAYDWGDVDFHSQVWESGNDQQGWQVDLSIAILRGPRLSSAANVNSFWREYTKGDDQPWRPIPIRVHGKPGFRSGDRIVWLDQPGIAPTVNLDLTRFGAGELLPTARGLRQLPD